MECVINQNQQFEGRIGDLEADLKRQLKVNSKQSSITAELRTEGQVNENLGVQQEPKNQHVHSGNKTKTEIQAMPKLKLNNTRVIKRKQDE